LRRGPDGVDCRGERDMKAEAIWERRKEEGRIWMLGEALGAVVMDVAVRSGKAK
jgi:hypothetical protein